MDSNGNHGYDSLEYSACQKVSKTFSHGLTTGINIQVCLAQSQFMLLSC